MEILSYITRRASNAGAAVEHPNFTPTSAKPKFPQVTAVPVSSERKSELLKAAQSIASRVEASARATDWTYVMKKDGIDVSRITTATSAFQKFRGVGIIPHPLQDCVNCVVENEISIKFDTLMVQGDIIETLDDNKGESI